MGWQDHAAGRPPLERRAHPQPLPHAGGEPRRYALLASLLLLLAACNATDDGQVEGSEPIPCLLPGSTDYKMLCTIDRMITPDGTVITARAPDGEFRRLLVVKDGRGVVAADGAEPVKVAPAGSDGIDVTAGDIVYRLPAKIAP